MVIQKFKQQNLKAGTKPVTDNFQIIQNGIQTKHLWLGQNFPVLVDPLR